MSLNDSLPHRQIWLIGGTQESAALAQAIAAHHLPCLITVTTASARRLYPTSPHLTVWVGRLQAATLLDFMQEQQIGLILDASHPFAVEISELAIATATQLDLPYLRYERPTVEEQPDQPTFSSFQALLSTGALWGQRVLLTVGYRPLAWFKPWQEQATLFARILPSVTALEAAIAAGFTPDRLIALRPPISADLERALWQQWQISVVVTKASGTPGGEAVKQQVAAAAGVQLIRIARPNITYPQQTSDIAIAVEFCLRHLLPAIAQRDAIDS
ncbi:MAG: cobalt-precorrin-6A reductase [Leptolyngbyaceae cyanobacterium bins.349]|nr:cobalt-precorrin-6A reductase [Leptolyngbyaceae cyanobacterium bins.349]